MKFQRAVTVAHRWLGLLLFGQVAVWMMSGVVMSWFPIELVRGETAATIDEPIELPIRSYFPPAGVVAQVSEATSVQLTSRFGRPVYLVRTRSGAALFDADDGRRLSPIKEQEARLVAEQDFLGDGEIASVELLERAPPDFSGRLPVWRATFDDRNGTRLYVSPETGDVVARRNNIWRLYDFFWMLHIMDYKERENFNNPLIKAASATGLLFALSGVYLVAVRLRNRRYSEDMKQLRPGPGVAARDAERPASEG